MEEKVFPIPKERRSLETPDYLIDEKGKAVFGTFEKEFKNLNLLQCDKPTYWGNCFKKKKLSLWEALTVNFKDGYLLSAISDIGFFGIVFNIFYDSKDHKVYSWMEMVKSKEVTFSENLISDKETSVSIPSVKMKFVNSFQIGKVSTDGFQQSKEMGKIDYHFDLKAYSLPSVVSMPFGKNRPVYSEKQFFKAEGKLIINGKEYLTDENSTAIINDHRGYYPRKAHYDWLTFMGRGKDGRLMGFNLTANQSLNPYCHNENLIFLEGTNRVLPPVHFTRSRATLDFVSDEKTPTIWTIKDDYGMVSLSFRLKGAFLKHQNYLLVKSDYLAVFGTMNGYLKDENGRFYDFNGLEAMGEDKTILL